MPISHTPVPRIGKDSRRHAERAAGDQEGWHEQLFGPWSGGRIKE
jgi:hypothetical protein